MVNRPYPKAVPWRWVGTEGGVNVSSATSILVGEVCSPIFNTTKFDNRMWVWCLVPPTQPLKRLHHPHPNTFFLQSHKKAVWESLQLRTPRYFNGLLHLFPGNYFLTLWKYRLCPRECVQWRTWGDQGRTHLSKVYHLLLVTNLKTGVLQ
jgi:hypothetical protein